MWRFHCATLLSTFFWSWFASSQRSSVSTRRFNFTLTENFVEKLDIRSHLRLRFSLLFYFFFLTNLLQNSSFFCAEWLPDHCVQVVPVYDRRFGNVSNCLFCHRCDTAPSLVTSYYHFRNVPDWQGFVGQHEDNVRDSGSQETTSERGSRRHSRSRPSPCW